MAFNSPEVKTSESDNVCYFKMFYCIFFFIEHAYYLPDAWLNLFYEQIEAEIDWKKTGYCMGIGGWVLEFEKEVRTACPIVIHFGICVVFQMDRKWIDFLWKWKLVSKYNGWHRLRFLPKLEQELWLYDAFLGSSFQHSKLNKVDTKDEEFKSKSITQDLT